MNAIEKMAEFLTSSPMRWSQHRYLNAKRDELPIKVFLDRMHRQVYGKGGSIIWTFKNEYLIRATKCAGNDPRVYFYINNDMRSVDDIIAIVTQDEVA